MSHYDLTDWVDFVRGVVTDERGAAMRRHLDAGCGACQSVADRMAAVALAAATDAQFEPPPHLLRFARAAFSLQRPERLWSLKGLAARLVFSSLDTALAAGVRGPAEELSRQSIYEAGDFSVHLRFEQPVGTSRVSLVGQVANRRVPDPPMAHVPVILTRGQNVVARSLSNEFGEFQIEYDPRPELHLHIPLADGRQRIRMALDGLPGGLTDEPGPRSSTTRAARLPSAGRRSRRRS